MGYTPYLNRKKQWIVLELSMISLVLIILLFYMVPKYLYLQSEEYAIAQVKKYGGVMKYDDEGHVIEVDLFVSIDENGNEILKPDRSDEICRVLPKFQYMQILRLTETQTSDRAMNFVGQIQSLKKIFLSQAVTTDKGIARLSGLTNLEYFACQRAKISDESLKILANLPKLKNLQLQHNYFTNKGLRYIKDMQQLEHLWIGIGECDITDEGIQYLTGLKNLQAVDLQGFKVTDQCIPYLKQIANLNRIAITSKSKITDDGKRELLKHFPGLEMNIPPAAIKH